MSDDSIQPNSLNISGLKLRQLSEIMPEVFSEGRVDVDKLKAALGEQFFIKDEHYELSWAGKTEAFKVLQQPTMATLAPAESESVNFDATENIFIEGENLEVLKILQKSYFGKIKMIYIDPPYNTGNDSFIYPDKFSESKDEYLKRIGSKDEEGYLTKDGFFRKNSKDNGHYHSNWLTMMYPRLYLARNLLKDDGVIFVSIDDNEVHNLRAIMNEIFGEENFVACFVWKRRASSALADNKISTDHEYVVCFQKGLFKEVRGIEKDFKNYNNPDNDPRGPWVLGDLTVGMTASMRPNQAYDLIDPTTKKVYPFNPNRVWAYYPPSMEKLLDENRIYFPDDVTKRPMLKRFKNELKDVMNPISSLLESIGLNTEATKLTQEIFGQNLFEYSKPLSLLNIITLQIANANDIILDFFSGSGTTAQAVLELNKEDGGNRKFICVQLPEKTDEDSEAYKAGYKTIADIGKERIRRVIHNIQKEKADKPELFNDKNIDLGFKVFKLKHSNFKLWRGDILETEEDLNTQMDAFENPKMQGAKEFNILYELMLKSGCLLSDKVEKKENYYSVNNGELIVAASGITDSAIKEIINAKPKKVIILDELFENNDQLKTNTALQMKDAGIEFRTV